MVCEIAVVTFLIYTPGGTIGILAGIFLFTYENYLVDNEEQQNHQPAGPVQHEWNLATLISALTITIIMSLLWYARLQLYSLFLYKLMGTLGILAGIFLFTAFLNYLMDDEEQLHHRPAGH